MNRIYDLRKEKGLTQLELAKALDVTQTAVSHWETGKNMPDTQQAITLADIFEVSIDYLLGQSDGRSTASESNGADPATIFSSQLIAAYGSTPPNLTDDDMADIADYIRFVEERKRKKQEDENKK